MPFIQLDQLGRRHGPDHQPTWALRGVCLDIDAGESVALVGPSGSGKSTLLHLLCGVDLPSSGTVTVGGQALGSLSRAALARWRGRHVGLVFQAFHLLPTLTALENVVMPMALCERWPRAERAPRAHALLEQLGVADQAHKLPADMSGGQQQRVAMARALANDPDLVAADEPTGNLDSASGERVLQALAAVAAAGKTVLMVTHDAQLAARFARRVQLFDGQVVA
jgi:putative ABC transport system ATP-binding protein